MQISAHAVASLLAHIFGPSFYDDPRFGRGDLGHLVAGPIPEPWRQVALNPQPLPPQETHALRLADAHIQGLLALDRLGSLHGGELGERALEQGLRAVAEIDDLCPRWPHWPRNWPPPPPPPWEREEMNPAALFLLGTRFLGASELAQNAKLQGALVALGEKAIGLALPRQAA